MKQQKQFSPLTIADDLALLEKEGLGDSLYATAFRDAIKENETNPGKGRGIVAATMQAIQRQNYP